MADEPSLASFETRLIFIIFLVRCDKLSKRCFVFLFAAALAPNMVCSSLNPDFNLNMYNAASSQQTLKIMLIIAVVGMPIVIAYTVMIYRVFWGKVQLTHESY